MNRNQIKLLMRLIIIVLASINATLYAFKYHAGELGIGFSICWYIITGVWCFMAIWDTK
jgi:hypothetical protein